MPNYALNLKNKSYDLGFFVCDMEADDYAISKFNLNSKDKYSIIETVIDSLDRTATQATPALSPDPASIPNLSDYLEAIEKKAIINALNKTNHNKTAAAKLLGVSFRTLRYRLSKLGLEKVSGADLDSDVI